MTELIAFIALVLGFCIGWVVCDARFHLRAQRIYCSDGREFVVVEERNPPREDDDVH